VKEKRDIWLPVALMVAFALTRLPGALPLNFSAAYALAFCAGVYLPGRMAWWLPLGVLLVTDVGLNLFYYDVAAVSGRMLVNYVAFAGIIGLGHWFRGRKSWLALLSGGLLGALLFYFITNTASWVSDPGYAKTLAGWIQALTTGLPGYPPTVAFFRNTLLSGGLFTGLFAAGMKLSERLQPEAEEEPEPAEEDEDPAPEESKA
jgi:hypothetical protein